MGDDGLLPADVPGSSELLGGGGTEAGVVSDDGGGLGVEVGVGVVVIGGGVAVGPVVVGEDSGSAGTDVSAVVVGAKVVGLEPGEDVSCATGIKTDGGS